MVVCRSVAAARARAVFCSCVLAGCSQLSLAEEKQINCVCRSATDLSAVMSDAQPWSSTKNYRGVPRTSTRPARRVTGGGVSGRPSPRLRLVPLQVSAEPLVQVPGRTVETAQGLIRGLDVDVYKRSPSQPHCGAAWFFTLPLDAETTPAKNGQPQR